jgi:uroporphyrinogen III methyltransferase/synthase
LSDAPSTGRVYLVGAGPWDPGLLTLRGREVLGRADVVVHDYLVNPELLAWAPKGAVHIPTGHRPGRLSQAEICEILVENAQAGRTVVRLKGGDPFVFGRGGEEAEALAQAGLAFEVVPGVTAAIAGAAFAGIPVTHRRYGSTLGLCTGHGQGDGEADPVDWRALAGMDTVVIYMGAKRLPTVAAALMAAGRAPETPVALVQWASRPSQRTVVTTLANAVADAAAAGLGPPVTAIVGEVVRLREELAWFERKPLFGKRIVVTRSLDQQAAFSGALAELGAEVLPLPTIAFAPPEDATPLHTALADLGRYHWVVLTSANGVDFFLDALKAARLDARALKAARVACIGPATAQRLEDRGLLADLVPERSVAEGLVEALLATGVAGCRILLPRAAVARDVLPEALAAAGAVVDVVPVYQTVETPADPGVLARIAAGEADLATFTSASTVQHFRRHFDDAQWSNVCSKIEAACIGPVTTEAATRLGLRVRIEADPFTIPALIEAIRRRG